MKRLAGIGLWLLLAWLAGCSTPPVVEPDGVAPPSLPPALEEERPPAETAPSVRPPSVANSAVAAIMLDANTAIQQGRYDLAASQLERALRIEPNNATLWHYLARVRLNQGRYSQAANLAAKSNALARGDAALIADNNRLIEIARRSGQ